VIVAALGLLALERGAKADREAANATSHALTASSTEPLRTRPDVSLALAFEAYRKAPLPETSAAALPRDRG
jgi:hypothetical protein